VKRQKENREKNQGIVNSKNEELENQPTRKTVITDIVLLQTPLGSFEYIISPIDNQGKPLIPLEEILKTKLEYNYHYYQKPLPIVAITDGASNIRKRLQSLSSQSITLILDWYHLCKKMREFLSMICRNKAEKNEHSKFLFFNLWRGNIVNVLTYLQTKIQYRNQQKLDKLTMYLIKHKREIINYQLRSQAGKTIGSGRNTVRLSLKRCCK